MISTIHRDVTASGVRLRVAELGSGSPVLLIHGLFFDHETWTTVMANLGAQFRMIAPDLPGFGASEKPAPSRFPYGIDAFTEAMADLYAGLDIGRAAVIGHGLGGAVALTLAARHPEFVSRLVLVGPLCYEAPSPAYERIATAPVLGGLALKQLWGRSLFRAYFRHRLLGPEAQVANHRIDRYYDLFNTPAARGSALATLRATRDTRPIVARTGNVGVPTLVVWGRADRNYPARFGQRLAKEIRNAGLEVIDAGHSPQEENPSELTRVVSRFLYPPKRNDEKLHPSIQRK